MLVREVIRFVLQSVSLLCVALGQPVFLPWLGPIASTIGFAVHWKSLDGLPLKEVGIVSFAWFFLVQLIQISWMANLEFQGIYILVVYFLLSAGLALQFSYISKIVRKSSSIDWKVMVFIAALWTLFEWGRLYVLCGFAFNFLGISLSCYLPSLQLASIFGIFGLSFWVVITNLASLNFFRTPSIRQGVYCLAIISIPYVYGLLTFEYFIQKDTYRKKEVYSTLLLQTALSPSQKYSLKGREGEFISPLMQWEKILYSISSHKEKALDLIVLPEAAVPFGLDIYLYKSSDIQLLFEKCFGELPKDCFPDLKMPFSIGSRVSNAYILQALANYFNSSVLSGLDYQSEIGEFFNSAFYFKPGSEYPKRYDKRVLLPLAEYMPFTFLTALSRYYGIQDFFVKGRKAEVFSESLLLSPSICYEELFPSLIREGRKAGAHLFVNLSNDGYYPSSKLPEQHFTHGLIRSVENGVPLIRSCNTGVTAAVDSFGRVLDKMQDEKGGVENISGGLFVQVPREHHLTGFVIWGDFPLILFSFAFVLLSWKSIRRNQAPFPLSERK
jgi:apolipoprotein N-acyltransferase